MDDNNSVFFSFFIVAIPWFHEFHVSMLVKGLTD